MGTQLLEKNVDCLFSMYGMYILLCAVFIYVNMYQFFQTFKTVLYFFNVLQRYYDIYHIIVI